MLEGRSNIIETFQPTQREYWAVSSLINQRMKTVYFKAALYLTEELKSK